MRVALMCLVATMVCLQGMAIGVFTALGPAHVHRATDSVQVLEDVRRWRPGTEHRATGSTLFGQLHGHSHHDAHGAAGMLRHYHATGDATVVKVANDPGLDAAGIDDGIGASMLLAACWAPSTATPAWQAACTADAPVPGPGWVPMGIVVEPLDRPPKTV